MLRTLLFWSLLAATVRPCLATKCVGDNSVCHAYATADAVFIGRVASLDPEVLKLPTKDCLRKRHSWKCAPISLWATQ